MEPDSIVTQDQIEAAREDGRKTFHKYGVSHLQSGEHRCEHKHPELIRAWLEGYDQARLRSL